MLVEAIEKHDWSIEPEDTCLVRRQKSIDAYNLYPNTWYEKIKDLTFETHFYDEIPDILPYDKCMVRWENKSPKDSEHWGPVSTKEEVERVFHTSLRCKTNPGKIYCFREWIKMYDEYHCFWNGSLCAVSGPPEHDFDERTIDKIMLYINSIQGRIPYIRCVFDICQIIENGELVFKIIEFNSWETLAGAEFFNWVDDTEQFYDSNEIAFKTRSFYSTRPKLQSLINLPQLETIPKPSNFVIIGLEEHNNYLNIGEYLYMYNDIWLGKFNWNLEPISWTRGLFRFNGIDIINYHLFAAGGNVYNRDLTIKCRTKTLHDNCGIYRYGCLIKNIDTDEFIFAHVLSDCSIVYTRV